MMYIMVGIFGFSMGLLLGFVLMGLMTASKIKSIYEEVYEWNHKKEVEDLDL